MNARTIVVVGATTIFAMACGSLLGESTGNAVLGTALGVVAGVPLGIFLVARRRRWLAVALLNTEFVLSYAVGGFPGFLFSVTAAALTFFVSASILRDFYGGSEIEAFRHHLQLALGMVKGFQILDAGTPTVSTETPVVLGPRRLIIKPGTGVCMELGSKISRVSGPTMLTTRPWEYVKHVHDLREKQHAFAFDGVITRDLMSTSVAVSATYGLWIADNARQGTAPLSPPEEAVLWDISQRVPDWEAATRTALEQAVRQAIGLASLSEVLRGPIYPQLEHEVCRRVNHITGTWGVRVRSITLESIRAKPEVMAAIDSRRMETARAEGMREALTLLAEGYKRAKTAGMTDDQITHEVVRRTIEQLAHDPATKLVITPEMFEFASRWTENKAEVGAAQERLSVDDPATEAGS